VADLRDRHLLQQCVVVLAGLLAITRRLLPITSRLLPIDRGASSALSRRLAIVGGTFAVLGSARHDLRAPVPGRASVACIHLAIVSIGGLIARRCRQIAIVRAPIAIDGGVTTSLGAVLALLATPIAEIARKTMDAGVAAVYEVAVAGSLIGLGRGLVTIGCGLISIGCGLIGVGCRLVSIRERLVVISERLTSERLTVAALRTRGLLRSLARPVRGPDGMIT
jgi:hypothetical protein